MPSAPGAVAETFGLAPQGGGRIAIARRAPSAAPAVGDATENAVVDSGDGADRLSMGPTGGVLGLIAAGLCRCWMTRTSSRPRRSTSTC